MGRRQLHQQSTRVARYNRAVVLDYIRRHGPVSKSELAERSELALSSVSNVLSSLARHGLIRSVGMGPSTGGRPPQLVELNSGAHYAAGVNVRPAGVEAVLVDLVGDIMAETALPLRGVNPGHVMTTVAESVDQVVRMARIDPARMLGAGVACPAPVRDGSVVTAGPPWAAWQDVPLAERLERRLGLPISLDNAAKAAALAEHRYGAGMNLNRDDSLVYIYVDHGIGEGIIIDDTIYGGAHGLAGDLGHVVVDADGPPCPCGQHGCLETLASVDSVLRRVISRAKLGVPTVLHDKVDGDWGALTYEMLCEAVEAGDSVAGTALEEAVAYLAVGVGNAVRHLQPHLVIVGGELFERFPDLIARLQRALENRSALCATFTPRVVLGQLGSCAAPLGAAALVLERFFGVPAHVIRAEPVSAATDPSFDSTLLWPVRAEEGMLLTRSDVEVAWAGNLQPSHRRVGRSTSVTVTVDVTSRGDLAAAEAGVKVLLHWDRVPVFGASWPTPKNSPMHLAHVRDGTATYSVTLSSLPPGKYEYAAHVLGANDLWVRTGGPGETNGRIEVLPTRLFPDQEGQVSSEGSGKEEMRVSASGSR